MQITRKSRKKNLARLRRSLARRSCRFEQLDDRRLLTLWTVTSLSDVVANDGQLSLREAFMTAYDNTDVNEAIAGEVNGTDIIRFVDELFAAGPITLPLSSNQPLKLGGDQISGGDLSVSGFQFQNSLGSAINLSAKAEDTINVSQVRFIDNHTVDSGGAIHVGVGSLVVEDAVFDANSAQSSGGAIAVTGNAQVIVNDSQFTGNTTEGSGGVIAGTGEAVAIANLRSDHNTIRFSENLIRTIDDKTNAMFLLDTLRIEFDTSIIGPGLSQLGIVGESIVDTSPQALFEVSPVATLNMSGLTITSKPPESRPFDPGPAIENYGTANLDDLEVYYRSHGTIVNHGGSNGDRFSL